MSHFTFILTVIFLMMTSMGANAQDVKDRFDKLVAVDGIAYGIHKAEKTAAVIFHSTKDENGIALCDNYAGDFVVPANVNVDGEEYTVTELDEDAFAMSKITSLTLPSTLKKIGFSAISVCFNLTKANLPASVEEIGERAFNSCPMLRSVTIDEGNKNFVIESNMLMTTDKTRVLHYIGAYDEKEWVSVCLPSTVKKIDQGAFALCRGLKEIFLPEGLESIGMLSFAETGISSITIPSTVNNIEFSFASNAKNLKKIIVAEGNKNYKVVDSVLYDSAMTKLLRAETGIKSITIPETVTTICKGSIGNTNISTLVIPNTVKVLGFIAVSNNPLLKTVVIGSGVELIEAGALAYNDALESIYMQSRQPVKANKDTFLGTKIFETATLYVPTGTKQTYELDPFWGKFMNIAEFDSLGIR